MSDEKDNIYYENELFMVVPVKFADPVLNEQVEGYGVVNKSTGVREAEARRYFTAKALADGFEDQHKHPDKYLTPTVAATDSNTPRMH